MLCFKSSQVKAETKVTLISVPYLHCFKWEERVEQEGFILLRLHNLLDERFEKRWAGREDH